MCDRIPKEGKKSQKAGKPIELMNLGAVKECSDSHGSDLVQGVSYSKGEKKTEGVMTTMLSTGVLPPAKKFGRTMEHCEGDSVWLSKPSVFSLTLSQRQ